ncbi:NUDIX hydrolase [Patescibacteria group bacterium]|nr:NUDIX hydrolase [Patescibacteria group bacterium]
MSEDLFQLGIKALIRNPKGEILLLQINPEVRARRPEKAYWDLPGGRVQKGDTIKNTLRREITEETGITKLSKTIFFTSVLSNLRVPLADGDVGLILLVYLCEVDGAKDIKLSDEHTKAGWFTPAKASKLLHVKYPAEFCQKITVI